MMRTNLRQMALPKKAGRSTSAFTCTVLILRHGYSTRWRRVIATLLAVPGFGTPSASGHCDAPDPKYGTVRYRWTEPPPNPTLFALSDGKYVKVGFHGEDVVELKRKAQ
jgi:hypothetical protein